jgi:uncharacterized membrane protein HdeD (DUF308 family)
MFEVEAVRLAATDGISQRPWRYLALGAASLAFGILGLFFDWVTTIVTLVVFAPILIISGANHLVHAFLWRNPLTFVFRIPLGLIELVPGLLILWDPFGTLRGLALVVAAFFVAKGLYLVVFGTVVRFQSWSVWVATGLVMLALGVATGLEWPESSLWALGKIVSVYLIVSGGAFLALWARALEPGRPPRPAPRVPHPA